jgi:hypothetical protein
MATHQELIVRRVGTRLGIFEKAETKEKGGLCAPSANMSGIGDDPKLAKRNSQGEP